MQQLLPQSDVLVPQGASRDDIVKFINNYIDNYHCEDLNVDISWLNIMDSCFVSNLCSTHHYIKYPTGKITWNVISESVKNLSNALILGNSSFVKH